MNEHNEMVIDAWIVGRMSLACMLALLEREKEDIILDAIVV